MPKKQNKDRGRTTSRLIKDAESAMEQEYTDMLMQHARKLGMGIGALLQNMEIPYTLGYMALSPILRAALEQIMAKGREQGLLGEHVKQEMQKLVKVLNAYLGETGVDSQQSKD